MTPEETNVLLTEVTLVDNLIPNTDQTFTVWESALAGISLDQARAVVRTYYGNREPGGASITPGHIRRQVHREAERSAAKRAALERTPDRPVTVESWRRRNPAAWDAEARRGAVKRLEELERRGRLDDDDAARLARYRATGTLPARHERQNDPWSA